MELITVRNASRKYGTPAADIPEVSARMLSLKELRRASEIIDTEFRGHRVERWVQPDAQTLAFSVYGRDAEEDEGRKRFLRLSCAHQLSRISETGRLPKAPDRPPAFSSYLRAHLSRAVIQGARLVDDDRQLAIRLTAREGEFELLLCLMGNRSNMYILGSKGEVVSTLRSLPDTRPELKMGHRYLSPASQKPAPGEDRFQDASSASFLKAIETHYAPLGGEREQSDLAQRLGQVLKREVKNARRRFEKIEAELAEADFAGEYARQGELLKSVLGQITPGQTEIKVRDYETGDEVTIPLDPKKNAKGNLEATFKRYQKLLRRLAKAGGQVDEARDWLTFVEAQIARMAELAAEGGDSLPALEKIAAHPQINRMLQRRAAAQAGPSIPQDEKSKLPARLRDVPPKLIPRRYLSADGLEIWVGRSDEGNDHLTTRLARGKDLFFHVEGAPGSHVILRTDGRDDPPSESLLDACELAVRYSKQKNAGSAQVHIVPIKNVTKPKGAKVGLVHVTGGKSVLLRREEARLTRLVAAKID